MTATTSKKKTHIPTQTQKPAYLRTRSTNLYVPSISQKGIYCEGDRFDYVVPWAISEKKPGNKRIS